MSEINKMAPIASAEEDMSLIMPDEAESIIKELVSGRANYFCSFTPANDAERASLYNMMNAPEKSISDCVGQTINLVHVFAAPVDISDKETGEVTANVRVVLMDDKGVTYSAVSKGIITSLRALFAVFGNPETWKNPIPIVPRQVTVKNGRMTKLEINANALSAAKAK